LFFLATGKSRKGALGSLGVEMAALLENAPGVFLQGLYCVDGEGNVVFEQKLTNSAVAAVEQLAKECKVSVVAYDGDKLYSPELTESVIELTERYGEPKVAPLMTSLAAYEPGIHKILLMHENVEMLRRIRPQLEALAKENNACVTQAVPTMLEWMPGGCSKANGVSKLCEALGIDPSTELLAIGDAENDVGMLEMAAIGVAVGNACPRAQEAADFWMEETNDDGGAGSAMELFGFGLDE
jgi:hydroxymethylpyrimidine pyrophosphatase-like HAD family hydrolase